MRRLDSLFAKSTTKFMSLAAIFLELCQIIDCIKLDRDTIVA